MRVPGFVIATAALAAVLLLRPQRSFAAEVMIDDEPARGDEPEFPGSVTEGIPADFDFGLVNWNEVPAWIDNQRNVAAFLWMLRNAEHRASDVRSGRDYFTFYGGSSFSNDADHPVNTGERQGIPLKAEWCRAAGYPSGRCVSTAAGAYQFTRPTWNELRAAGAWGPRLPDFSPASQDEAARRLLIRLGALPLIERGLILEAIERASSRWASLPGSTSGQPQKPVSFVLAKFNEGLQG